MIKNTFAWTVLVLTSLQRYCVHMLTPPVERLDDNPGYKEGLGWRSCIYRCRRNIKLNTFCAFSIFIYFLYITWYYRDCHHRVSLRYMSKLEHDSAISSNEWKTNYIMRNRPMSKTYLVISGYLTKQNIGQTQWDNIRQWSSLKRST